MNIVLIEDDPQKAYRVTVALKEILSGCVVCLCRSYQSGLRRLEQTEPVDLVILDMSLPTFDQEPGSRSGRPRPLGGYELMRKVKRSGLTPAVIILTALESFGSHRQQFTFAEIAKMCEVEFPAIFKSAIYYSQSKSTWRQELEAATKVL
jgi:CheY-like chemotaxis protein